MKRTAPSLTEPLLLTGTQTIRWTRDMQLRTHWSAVWTLTVNPPGTQEGTPETTALSGSLKTTGERHGALLSTWGFVSTGLSLPTTQRRKRRHSILKPTAGISSRL